MSTVIKPSPTPQPTNPNQNGSDLAWLLIKAILFTFAVLIFFFVTTLAAAGWWVNSKITAFEKSAGISRKELIHTVRTNWGEPPTQTNQNILFLILGLDTVKNKPNQQPLSDTLLLANLNLTNSQISLLPLPRDTWSTEYQTKINALYYYGLEKYPTQPEKFPTEVISQLIQLPIEHTVIVSLEDLVSLIDLVGGIEVTVAEGFTDTQFPREDVDLATARPDQLYETITFATGSQHMDGSTASKYIRSRKSGGDTGNDVSRGNRQEQVLNALVSKIFDEAILTNPALLGQLFAFYNQKFAKSLSLTELVRIASQLSQNTEPPTLVTGTLSTNLTDTTNPVLMHPNPALYNNQWIFLPTSRQALVEAVHHQLGRTP